MNKRKKLKLKKKNFAILLTSIILVFSIVCYLIYFNKNEDSSDFFQLFDKNEEIIEINWPINQQFSMVTTGDALLHSSIYLQYETSDGYDFSNVFNMINSYINQFDIRYVNQETVFASGSYSGYPLFNTPSAWGDAMIDSGFNLFSLATNHSFDQYTSGAIENINYWQNKTGIGYAGMNLSNEDKNYFIDEINGITYGFLSYTEHTNGITVPDSVSYLVDIYNTKKAASDIEELRDLVDVIIVAMHWGDEYTSEPNNNQLTMANELADMNVDIIIGSHPHWTQPIDYINDTLVIYSLGNFLSNQLILTDSSYYTESVAVGALVSYDVNKDTYEDGTVNVYTDNIVVELIYNYRDSHGEYYIIPFSNMNSTYNKNYLTIYEEHKERFTMYSDLVTVNPVG